MNTSIDSTAEFIEMVYRKMDTAIGLVRTRLGRPLTYAEKVLYGHLDNGAEATLSLARPTLKPGRTGSPSRTPQPRWQSCSSCSQAKMRLPCR